MRTATARGTRTAFVRALKATCRARQHRQQHSRNSGDKDLQAVAREGGSRHKSAGSRPSGSVRRPAGAESCRQPTMKALIGCDRRGPDAKAARARLRRLVRRRRLRRQPEGTGATSASYPHGAVVSLFVNLSRSLTPITPTHDQQYAHSVGTRGIPTQRDVARGRPGRGLPLNTPIMDCFDSSGLRNP